MLYLSYEILAYATLAIWVILTCSMLYWIFRVKGEDTFKDIKENIEKRKKYKRILRIINYILCFFVFTMVISSLDILFMTIGVFNPIRLPFKGIILASNVSSYLVILFFRYMFKSALNYAESWWFIPSGSLACNLI